MGKGDFLQPEGLGDLSRMLVDWRQRKGSFCISVGNSKVQCFKWRCESFGCPQALIVPACVLAAAKLWCVVCGLHEVPTLLPLVPCLWSSALFSFQYPGRGGLPCSVCTPTCRAAEVGTAQDGLSLEQNS